MAPIEENNSNNDPQQEQQPQQQVQTEQPVREPMRDITPYEERSLQERDIQRK